MKRLLAFIMILMFASSTEVQAVTWDSFLNFWNKVSADQNTQVQQITTLNDVEARMDKLDTDVQNTFLDIVSLLSTKKEAKNIKSQVQSDVTAIDTIIANYTNTLVSDKENFVKTVSKLSSKNKAALLSDIATLAEESQNYLVLATNGIKVASKTMQTAQKVNDMANTLTNINKIAYELRTKASTVVTFANQLKTVASAAGLAVK